MTAALAPNLRPYGLVPTVPRKKRRLWAWIALVVLLSLLLILFFLPLMTA